MLKTLLWRLLFGGATLFLVSVLIFAGTEMLPGDAASAILGQAATEEAKAAIRAGLQLERPALERYGDWLGGLVRGDFGTSYLNRRPVVDEMLPRLWNTLFLAGYAAAIAVPLALLFGILASIWRDSLFDRIINVGALIMTSLPAFFVAYALIAIFAVELQWFPSLSSISSLTPFGEKLHATFLPVLGLVVMVVPHIARMTRAALYDIWSSSFIEMAELKGIPRGRIVWLHALPNALAPIISVIALNLAFLVTGVLIIEVIFVYPGLGPYMIDAVSLRDMPAVQACGLVFAAAFILINLAADLGVVIGNPRLRHPK